METDYMQMTTEGRTWLDATVRRILARHPLGDAERAGVTYELMSHVHAGAEAHAGTLGHTEITMQDLQAAVASSGGEDALAAAFVQPLAKPIERVLFWRRLGAFAIDALLLGIVLGFLHGTLTLLLASGHVDAAASARSSEDDFGWYGFMPWGYHDRALPAAVQLVIAGASGLLVLGYFTWLESREGRSLGKRALGLRVVRTDGLPMTTRESLLRNLVKVAPPLLVIDTLVMLVFLNKDKQRISDRIAQTIVVRA
jgi:uncharacterized RDD family membrane protein YckC